jgi:hypothetical protein
MKIDWSALADELFCKIENFELAFSAGSSRNTVEFRNAQPELGSREGIHDA